MVSISPTTPPAALSRLISPGWPGFVGHRERLGARAGGGPVRRALGAGHRHRRGRRGAGRGSAAIAAPPPPAPGTSTSTPATAHGRRAASRSHRAAAQRRRRGPAGAGAGAAAGAAGGAAAWAAGRRGGRGGALGGGAGRGGRAARAQERRDDHGQVDDPGDHLQHRHPWRQLGGPADERDPPRVRVHVRGQVERDPALPRQQAGLLQVAQAVGQHARGDHDQRDRGPAEEHPDVQPDRLPVQQPAQRHGGGEAERGADQRRRRLSPTPAPPSTGTGSSPAPPGRPRGRR